MNDRLKAELWEIQIILYLILAQLVKTHWVKVALWVWCVITFLGIMSLLVKVREELKKKGKL